MSKTRVMRSERVVVREHFVIGRAQHVVLERQIVAGLYRLCGPGRQARPAEVFGARQYLMLHAQNVRRFPTLPSRPLNGSRSLARRAGRSYCGVAPRNARTSAADLSATSSIGIWPV